VDSLADKDLIVLRLYKTNAFNDLVMLVGNNDPEIAKQENPNSLIGLFGSDVVNNGFYIPKNEGQLLQLETYFFKNNIQLNDNVNLPNEHALMIIKPYAAKMYGDSIRAYLIARNYKIIQDKVFQLNIKDTYKLTLDVPLNLQREMNEYICSGKIIVLIIEKKSVHFMIENIIGHRNPRIAKKTNPDSIRALYGTNFIQNAIETSTNDQVFQHNYNILFHENGNNVDGYGYTQTYENMQQQNDQNNNVINTNDERNTSPPISIQPTRTKTTNIIVNDNDTNKMLIANIPETIREETFNGENNEDNN